MRNALVFALFLAPFAASAETPAQATLPLDDVLKLHRELDEAKEKPASPPPIAASLDAVEMTASLLDGAIEVQANVRVTSLSPKWVTIPLVRSGPSLRWTSVPAVENAHVVLREGRLVYLTDTAGSRGFDVSFSERAERTGTRRRAVIDVEGATVATLRVKADEGSFRVLSAGDREGGFIAIPGENGHFEITWDVPEQVATKAQQVETKPVEPVVLRASGSLVSTLEGRQILRVLYDLQLTSARDIAFTLPSGFSLRRAFLNGVPVDAEADDGHVTMHASPARAGERSAAVELVVEREHVGYALSGRVGVELPRVSWMVHETTLFVHLPDVFRYTWDGGSLSPVADASEPAYSLDLPTPGTVLSFRQHLVAESAPSVTLRYAVDLANGYYR